MTHAPKAPADVWDMLCGERTFLIAEIGSNHDGDLNTALRLMDLAREAGAQAVKFQSFLADHLVKPDNPDYELLKSIEVPREWYPRLVREARERGLYFFSTATNEITLGWMEEAGAELYKLASPNLSHLPLIRTVAALGKPVVVSTGMADLTGIDEAVRTFREAGNERLALLHCVTLYPAPPGAMNLRFIPTLAALYRDFPVGFSDHTMGLGTAVAAVALGARIIEKHVTLDRTRKGPDHHYALEPAEFLALGREIRIAEQALGRSVKTLDPAELDKRAKYYRSLHAACDVTAGAVLEPSMIAVVRPDDGLHPRHLEAVTGLTLRRALRAGDAIGWHHFKGD